ncbi:hypothetical protein Lal_00019926 [Lupinus albus]|nr:hypothetical protein Lal_00019926 [Lupinus albus]
MHPFGTSTAFEAAWNEVLLIPGSCSRFINFILLLILIVGRYISASYEMSQLLLSKTGSKIKALVLWIHEFKIISMQLFLDRIGLDLFVTATMTIYIDKEKALENHMGQGHFEMQKTQHGNLKLINYVCYLICSVMVITTTK